MSLTLHMWYAPEQRADDALLMSYSSDSYTQSTDPYRMAKNQAYGMFLRLVSHSGIPVDVVYFLFWLIAALIMSFAVHAFFHNRWLSLFAYVYILWNPIAFEDWSGTRVYRNSIIAPSLFILLALLMLYLIIRMPLLIHTHQQKDSSSTSYIEKSMPLIVRLVGCVLVLLLAVLTGVWFAFIYDVKEDSFWLVPMLIFIVLIKIVQSLVSARRWWARLLVAVLCLTPLISTYVCLETLRANNERDFGVALLNTRTEGALAEFIGYLYMVDSSKQTPNVWAPADSIEQVFAVSPTLSQYPEMFEYITSEDYASPDIQESPILGDLISWQLINAVDATIGMNNQRTVQRVFAKANNEIRQAFNTGELHRTSKIMPVQSLVPRTRQQIEQLIQPTANLYMDTLLLKRGYHVTAHRNMISSNAYNIFGLSQLNIDVDNPNPQVFDWFTFRDARRTASRIVSTYRTVNIVLIVICAMGLVTSMIAVIRGRWKPLANIGLTACLGAYAFVYLFAISWFTQYVHRYYVTFFYAYGPATALLSTGILIGVGALITSIRGLYTNATK
ncbi:hypothetical protein D2E25_1016 [Bifidobacterium goeldii]|uniref:Uncharacterized protein n=2 Tax=Bifidobacterium goeldii TaxID=2306975 RepID=A0A430FLB5_9BIFI|nr:hypothetical protein D2E25_1016 [Bifidobacterium goeldii]